MTSSKQTALARRIADEHRGTGFDRYEEAVLAAIIETTELAAKMADERAEEWRLALSNGLQKVAVSRAYANGAQSEAEVIASSIRTSLKGPAHDEQ